MLINDLPDDCLRKIFSRLPLSCKLTLHRICPRWRSLQYSVTSTHKSISILIGSNSRMLLANSCLKIPYLNQIEPHNSPFRESSTLELLNLSKNVTCQLMQLLPNITSFELCLNNCEMSAMDHVLELLRFWSSQLKFLSLFYENTRPSRLLPGVMSHLQQINEHCLALDFLSIELRGDFQANQKNFRRKRFKEQSIAKHILDLPCLKWLKEFRFYSRDQVDVLFGSFKIYVPESVRLEKIAIGNFITLAHFDKVDDLFESVPQIVSMLTLYRGIQSPIEHPKFTSLTTLTMNFGVYSWTQFTTYLSPLKNLIHLRFLIRDALSQYDSTPSYELVQLPSIRIIQINLGARTFRELQSRHWGWIFPSLQLLELLVYNDSEAPTQVDAQSARWNLMLEPFKRQCATLRRIVSLDKFTYYDKERKVWELGEDNSWNEVVEE